MSGNPHQLSSEREHSKERTAVDEWLMCIAAGDDFLVAYTQMSPRLAGVATFLIGHATELYLKAVLLKRGMPPCKIKNYSHNLKSLLNRCRQEDPKFPVVFEFRDTVLTALQNSGGVRVCNCLSSDDAKHFVEYLELYYAARAQGDLKYIGTIMERKLEILHVSYPLSGVKLMLEIFDPIRSYLEITADVGSVIRHYLEPPWGEAAPIKLLAEYDLRKRAQQAVSP